MIDKSFESAGYKSTNILKNLGLIAVGIAMLVGVVLLVLLIKFIVKKYPKLQPAYDFISAKLFFNSIIRVALETYLKLAISTMIAIKELKFEDSESKLNSVLSIGTLIFLLACPIFSYSFLRVNKHRLEYFPFKKRVVSLYLNVDTKREGAVLLGTYFILRRLTFALIVVFMV